MSDAEIKKILADNKSGSIEITKRINNLLIRKVSHIDELRKYVSIFESKLTAFAAVQNYLKEVKKILAKNDVKKLKNFLSNYKSKNQNKYLKIYSNAKSYLKKFNSVLTISNSATIMEVINLWFQENKQIEIYLCESRPMNEGREMAKRLLKLGLKVNFITEAMIGRYLNKVDAVIIGADKILKNGNVINKIGSLVLAITAKHFRKPFIVLTDRSKFVNSNKLVIDFHPPKEIWSFKHKKLNIINEYFEVIDKRLIKKIITD